MKEIKKIVIPVILAILFGIIIGRKVFSIYKNDVYNDLASSRLYLIESGEYDNLDNMREDNDGINYIYFKDNDKYKTVVGITKEYDNVDKIKALYNDDVMVYEYYVAKDLIDSRQDEYESILLKTNDTLEVKEMVNNILSLYKGDDTVRLVSVN